MRLIFRPWTYNILILVQSLLAAFLILLLVIKYDHGVLGFFIGSLTASFVVGIFGWFITRNYLDFKNLHFKWWPKLLRFGLPLVPAALCFYFMSSLDRWFIQHFHGADTLGLYAIGAKLSMFIVMGVEMFRKAWWPIAMDAMHGEDGPEVFRMISRFYLGLGVIMIIILTSISPWLIKILAAPLYHDAWPIVGILGWQSMFYGFFLIAAAGLTKVEKTYLYPILMGSALIIGVIMNWFLIPKFGIIGAALASAITYLVWILVSMLVSERFWCIGLLNSTFFCQISLGILACTLLLAPNINPTIRIICTITSIVFLTRISIELEIFQLFKSKLRRIYKI